MRDALNYACRTLAGIYLLFWVMVGTNAIGKESSGDPITWGGAWQAIAIIAMSMWMGYQAGRESKEPKP